MTIHTACVVSEQPKGGFDIKGFPRMPTSRDPLLRFGPARFIDSKFVSAAALSEGLETFDPVDR